jgi:putative drug exporter of the RND superfamily
MRRLSGLSIRRPWPILGCWLVLLIVLGLFATKLHERLATTVLTVPGTEAAEAIDIYEAQFGESVTVPILLTGPEKELDRQGPRAVRALRQAPGVRTLSPWDSGEAAEGLRPESDAALIVATIDVEFEQAVDRVETQVTEVVADRIAEPVEMHVSGLAAIGKALRDRSFDSARQAERIAFPALFIVLLLVFRSPIAAAIPAILGAATVLGSMGVLSIVATLTDIDAIAMSLASMMGLALGVDYALLMVSRFREELARGRGTTAAAAAAATAGTAGRTVFFAGLTLVAAMVVALALSPGDLLLSAALGLIVVGILAVGGALLVIPGVLAMLGPRVNMWTLGSAAPGAGRFAVMAGAASRYPLVIVVPVLVLLALLIAPALAMTTGPPDVRQLPEDDPTRQDFELLADLMGPGWATPFEVVAVSRAGTITEADRLERIERWQARLARDPEVDTVVGPGQVRDEARALRDAKQAFRELPGELRGAADGIDDLAEGLGRGSEGLAMLVDGLAEAARAAGALSEGAGTASAESRRLAEGLRQAEAGLERLRDGLAEAAGGASRLADGAGDARSGAAELEEGLAEARRSVEQSLPRIRRLRRELERGADDLDRLRGPAVTTEEELREAREALESMTIGLADPQYPTAYESVLRALGAITGRDPITGAQIDPDYPGMERALAQASDGLEQAAAGVAELERGSRELRDGLGELEQGAEELGEGIAELEQGAERLAERLGEASGSVGEFADAIDPLVEGAGEFEAGLARLAGGLVELRGGLAEGHARTAELGSGLERAGAEVRAFDSDSMRSDADTVEEFRRSTPGFFDSGYYILAALEGAPRPERTQSQFVINVGEGGQAGRILVVPESGPNTEQTRDLRHRLSDRADGLAERADVETAVGGQGAILIDFDAATEESFPLLVVALLVITFLILIPILRAVLLAAISVLLNLVTVAAAFGVLAFLFVGDDPILGGSGFLNAIAVSSIFAVIFALSIDYQLFLLTRMREGYDRTGDNEAAIAYGLQRTAGVITGAAAIMAAVFIAFAFTDVASTQQFGIGLAVAVILDATVVRLFLLPVAMRLGGRATWWLPGWLDRRLPRIQH